MPISDLLTRLRALVFRRTEERELNEELDFHLSMEEDYRRRHGETHAEAHRKARIALGGIEQVKENVRDARGTRLFDDGSSDFRFALRNLRRSPAFASVAVATLAIGIGGTTAMFSAVDAVMLQPLPYRAPGQLVRIYHTDVGAPNEKSFLTPVHFLAYRSRLSLVSSLAGVMTYSENGADLGSGDGARRIRMLPTTADYFDVVGVHPTLGTTYTADDENQTSAVVVVSERLWKDELRGDASAVGSMLTLNGKKYRVAGVMPGGFTDPLVSDVDAWVPLDVTAGRDASNSNNHYFTAIARLRPGVTLAAAQSEITSLAQTLGKQYPDARDARARMDPLKDDIVGSSSLALKIMLGAVALVLLVVCVNIATLMLVRGSERQSEFAVRAALGGERTRLVRQMLVECLALALMGDIAGLVVARVAMAGIVVMGDGTIPRLANMSLNGGVLAVSVLVATASALIFGLAPALRVARTDPSDVLRGSSRGSTGGARQMRGREWLVVVQVALAFVLVVGAGLLLSSLSRLQEVPLGVDTRNVLTFEVHLPEARYDSTARAAFYDAFAKRVEQLPGVRAAGGVSKLPATGSYNSWGTRPLTGPLVNDQTHYASIEQRVISGDYFRAVGIHLIKGRMFDERDDASAPARVVISAKVAQKLFAGVDPIGQRLYSGGHPREVIGVVSDNALDNEGEMPGHIYHAHRQFAGDRNWALTQVVATSEKADVLPSIRSLLSSVDPLLVLFRPTSFEDVIGRGAAQRVFTARVLLAFATIAIVLAGLGLFGVLSYGVRLRTRELGIRMALGARASTIRVMIMRQGLVLTAIGLVIGLIGAAALSRVVASMLFHVKPMDLGVLGGACVVLATVGALAAFLPARRATSIDPRQSLS
ncbi:MAG TPA: ABC transporter permease [Gemmatimonadaceae bacterium]|jgi:predicted permease